MKPPSHLLIQVTIRDTEPLVWRILQVERKHTLLDLHAAICVSLDWSGVHRFEFGYLGKTYRMPDLDDMFNGEETVDPRKAKLYDLLTALNDTMYYRYDFDANWECDVMVIGFTSGQSVFRDSISLRTGAMMSPVENCGGVAAHNEMVQLLMKSTPTAIAKAWKISRYKVPNPWEMAEKLEYGFTSSVKSLARRIDQSHCRPLS